MMGSVVESQYFETVIVVDYTVAAVVIASNHLSLGHQSGFDC